MLATQSLKQRPSWGAVATRLRGSTGLWGCTTWGGGSGCTRRCCRTARPSSPVTSNAPTRTCAQEGADELRVMLPQVLATGSYDGTIKMWDVTRMVSPSPRPTPSPSPSPTPSPSPSDSGCPPPSLFRVYNGADVRYNGGRQAVTCTMTPNAGVVYSIAWPPNADDHRL
eukprot:2123488-Rhodomonas_salina.1